MEFNSPMLARPCTVDDFYVRNWQGYSLEPKHDGMRAVVTRTHSGVTIQSRTGKHYEDHVPHLVKEFMTYLKPGTILDGELAVIDYYPMIFNQHVPVVDFNRTMRIMGSKPERAIEVSSQGIPVSFIIFDLLKEQETSLTKMSQHGRRLRLDSLWTMMRYSTAFCLNPVYSNSEDFPYIYNELVENKIEGVIMKNSLARYEYDGRPRETWFKVKSEKTFDVVVMGFTEGKGKYLGQVGAIEFGALDDKGNLMYVGRCSGMDDIERRRWTTIRDSGILESTVIEVKCNDLVGSGKYRTPRHPRIVCVRLDKTAEQCSMEQFRGV